MIKLTQRYVDAMLKYADENNMLESFYKYSLVLTDEIPWTEMPPIPEELTGFLSHVPHEEQDEVMRKFKEASRERIGIVSVEVISAIELSERQREELKGKLLRFLNKRVEMKMRVDPSVLGGLRIVAGYTVIDDTIKRKLSDIKRSAYKGVYSKK